MIPLTYVLIGLPVPIILKRTWGTCYTELIYIETLEAIVVDTLRYCRERDKLISWIS